MPRFQVCTAFVLAFAFSAASQAVPGREFLAERSSTQHDPSEDPADREPLLHPGNVAGDCYESCGGAGYCNDFCGQGNACCHRQGGISVPEECKGIADEFWSWGYECVVPHARPVTDNEAQLGAGPDETAELGAAEMGAGTSHEQANGFILLGAGSLIVIAMMAKYHLANEDSLQGPEDSDSDLCELSLTEEKLERAPLPRNAAARVMQPMTAILQRPAEVMQPTIASFQREPVAPTLLSSMAPEKLQLVAPNK